MYNFRLKEYNNGTLQLTFYSNPIRLKEDRYRPCNDVQGSNYYEEPSRRFDDPDNLYSLNPFVSFEDMYKVSLISSENEGAELDDELVCLTDEELTEKKNRSLKSSINRSKRMIYDYGRSNIWDWFFTFTFAPCDGFDKDNYEECKKKVTKWFHHVRERFCKQIKYLIVPEMHKSGAWHFHALVSNCDGLTFTKAINQREWLMIDGEYVFDKKGQHIPNKYFGEYLRKSYPDGEFIYNVKEYKSGFTTCTRITDTRKAVSYIVKYITKDLCEITMGKRRYLPSCNLELPKKSYVMCGQDHINTILSEIEYTYNVQLSIDCIKTYIIDVPNYYNSITVFEFNPMEKKLQIS